MLDLDRRIIPQGDAQRASIPVQQDTLVLRDVVLERGRVLPIVRIPYRLEGSIDARRDNVVLVVHALTGDRHASAWWPGVIGDGCAVDPARHAVLCAHLLDASALPASDPDRHGGTSSTTRDQGTVLGRVLDALGITRPLLVCGGSLGGMVTLEFAASFPGRLRAGVVLAAPAVQTAQGLAWNAIMRHAIAIGGEKEGLALARMVGMLSYRTPEGLERRFGRARNAKGDPLVAEWLAMHGAKLVARFDARRYTSHLQAMDLHDVGRDRGGVAAALAPVAHRLTGVGIVGDLLYPADTVREWAGSLRARYHAFASPHGHDGFLLEHARVGRVLRDALAAVPP